MILDKREFVFRLTAAATREEQVRTPKQEAHWLKSKPDPLQPLPTRRQAMLPEQKDCWEGLKVGTRTRGSLVSAFTYI